MSLLVIAVCMADLRDSDGGCRMPVVAGMKQVRAGGDEANMDEVRGATAAGIRETAELAAAGRQRR